MKEILVLTIPVLVAVVAALIRAYAVPFYHKVVSPYFNGKGTPKQREMLFKYIALAVNYAEKVFTEKSAGQAKKEFVLSLIESTFKIKLDKVLIDKLIEAAVNEMNKYKAEEAAEDAAMAELEAKNTLIVE